MTPPNPPPTDARLRELHLHVCPERGNPDDGLRDCTADEDDPHEAGVCAAWDALRDARTAGRAEAFEEAIRATDDEALRWGLIDGDEFERGWTGCAQDLRRQFRSLAARVDDAR